MIVPLGYVTTLPAARNASTCEEASGVRIISRKSWPMVSTDVPKDYSSLNGTGFRKILNVTQFWEWNVWGGGVRLSSPWHRTANV